MELLRLLRPIWRFVFIFFMIVVYLPLLGLIEDMAKVPSKGMGFFSIGTTLIFVCLIAIFVYWRKPPKDPIKDSGFKTPHLNEITGGIFMGFIGLIFIAISYLI